jgi:hypothetical protein
MWLATCCSSFVPAIRLHDLQDFQDLHVNHENPCNPVKRLIVKEYSSEIQIFCSLCSAGNSHF